MSLNLYVKDPREARTKQVAEEREAIMKIAKARWLARTNMYYLCNKVLGYKDVNPAVHYGLIRTLQQFPMPAENEWFKYDKPMVRADGSVVWNYTPVIPNMLDLPGGRRRLILDSRGTLKCHCDSNWMRKASGEYVQTKDIEVGDVLDGIDENFRFTPVVIERKELQGEQECYRITTRTGRVLEVSHNHPLRMVDKWIEAEKLKPKDRIAIHGRLPEPEGAQDVVYDEILGWFLGDGNISGSTITQKRDRFVQWIIEAAQKAGFTADAIEYDPVKRPGIKTVRVQGARDLFRELGYLKKDWYAKSADKFVPDTIFRASNASVGRFLAALFAADGTFGTGSISYCSISKRLCQDIQRLLLRFGIRSRVSTISTKYKREPYTCYHLHVQGMENILQFVASIGWYKECRFKWPKGKANPNVNTVPKQWRKLFPKYFFARGERPDDLPKLWNKKQNRFIPKSLSSYNADKKYLKAICQYRPDALMEGLASDEVFWDEVVSVEPIGKQRTWAIQTNKRNYSISDVVTHNTSINIMAHSVQWILNYPDIAILLVHAKAEIAEDILGEVRDMFAFCEPLRHLFPELCPEADQIKHFGNRSRFTIPGRSKIRKEPTMDTTSITSAIAGAHFDVIKFTDCVEEQNAANKEMRNDVSKKFSLFRNVLSTPMHWIDVEGTRYHFDDQYGRIIDGEKTLPLEHRVWSIYVRGCYKKKLPSGQTDYHFSPEELELPDLLDENGKKVSWWPERFPTWFLEREENDPTGEIFDFNSQRRNHPVGDSKTLDFPASVIQWIPEKELRSIRAEYYVTTVDTAETQNAQSNFSVITTCMWDCNNRCYVVDVRRAKMKPDELVSQLFDVYAKWRPIVVRIEETSYTRGLQYGLRREMDLKQFSVPFDFVKPDNQKSKQERIRLTLQPVLRRGDLRFSEGLPSDVKDAIYQEFTQFPKGISDDILDTLADQFQNKTFYGRIRERETFETMSQKAFNALVQGLENPYANPTLPEESYYSRTGGL